MADRYWNPDSQQWEIKGGGGSTNVAPPPAPIPASSGVIPTGGNPYQLNRFGESYAGRTMLGEGAPGLEGNDLSNYFDPSFLMAEQYGSFNPETGQYEGGYRGAYDALYAGERDVANRVGDDLIQQGRDVAQQSDVLSGQMAQDADAVARYGPAAVAASQDAAARMRAYGDQVGAYGPMAVQAAQDAAYRMNREADAIRGFSDPAAGVLTSFGGDQLGLYGDSFRPVDERIAERALAFNTPERQHLEGQRRAQDFHSRMSRMRDAAVRDLARYGVDTSGGRGMEAIRRGVEDALGGAASYDAGRRWTEMYGDQLLAGASNVGAGVAGRGMGATQAGAGLGMQGATSAAGVRDAAGNLVQRGISQGAGIGTQAANIAAGAGSMQNQGFQTGANIGTSAANIRGSAAETGQRGAATSGNVQTAGIGARQSTLPIMDRGSRLATEGVNAMQNWNNMIASTRGNRMEAPGIGTQLLSGLVGAAGQGLGTYLGSQIPLPGEKKPTADGGVIGLNDGGFLYSTRQRFADGGGILPAGSPVSAWLNNAPARPVVGRADGGLTIDGECQIIGGEPRMPDGSRCEVKANKMADGGSLAKTLAPLLGSLIGGAVGGPGGAVVGGKLGATAASAVGGGGSKGGSRRQSAVTTPIPQPTPLVGVGQPAQPGLADGTQGGVIHGPGDGVSDSVPAVTNTGQQVALSNREYIVPADVVLKLGTDYFDKLVEKNHVPAEVQRRTGVIA